VAAVVLGAVVCPLAAGEFVPFVIPADWSDTAEINFSSPPIGVKSPRMVARGEHFYVGPKRVRVWGVNMCFGACFPTHGDAQRVAKRLAAFGINSVRFHHMDSSAYPRGIWDRKDPMKLSAEAVDRLDYFIDQLARKGIWTNINLHVSRTHSRYLKLPHPGAGLSYDKMVDIFTPQLIEAQKAYARDLLSHVNPYRKVSYAADPAVAFVEITNEDSLFMWGAEQKLRGLPEFYAKILRERYAAWLKDRYVTTAGLRKAWSAGSQAQGADVLGPMKLGDGGWGLEQHGGCKATVRADAKTKDVRVEISKSDSTQWHIQLNVRGVKVSKGTYYTVTFRARADKARALGVNVGQAHDPWGPLGLNGGAKLTDTWQDFRMGFIATGDDADARVNFQLGGAGTAVELADVRLRPGGRMGLAGGESIERANVALFAQSETPVRSLDRMRFLAETEKGYFDGMRNFVKKDLACGALVTGTIVFGPLGMWAQSDMDFIDAHAYWQHPNFPGRPWDGGNWLVEQKAMVDDPAGSTLFRLASERLKGKPFTVSEYNHPAPNDYQTECVPMLASFAAAQDWDGIWLFTYSHSADNWDRKTMNSFFDIDTNPAKWGFVPAGTAIFREGGIAPVKGELTVAIGGPRGDLGELAKLHLAHDRNMFGIVKERGKVKWGDLLTRRVAMSLGGKTVRTPPAGGKEAKGAVEWLNTTLGKKLVFHAGGSGASVTLGSVEWMDGFKHPHVRTMTAMDSRPLALSERILITFCGRCENTGMQFSKDRRTVGRNWGIAPVRIEALARETVSLPHQGTRKLRCYALAPDGSRGVELDIYDKGDRRVTLDPKYKTMWYLVVREGKAPAER